MIYLAKCGADVEHSDSLPYDDQPIGRVRALVAFGKRTFEMAATLFCGQ